MSTQNPELQPPESPPKNSPVQAGAPDFVETPEAVSSWSEDREPLPFWIYLVCGGALFLAGSSFIGFLGPGVYDRGPGAAIMATSSQDNVPAAPLDPMDMGKQVYDGDCASCHQASGMGQPGSYPPIVGSEWVLGDKTVLEAILLHGVSGPINVKGDSYGSQQMPAWSSVLTDDKLAAVISYIRGSWGNTEGMVTPEDVAAARTKLAAQSDTYTQDQLMKMAPKKK